MNALFWSILFLLPAAVIGECTCETDDAPATHDRSLALKYKGASIGSILTASLVGVTLPAAGNWVPALSPEKNCFFVVKAFAAGVILATGFIHVLPDAFESLTSSCIPESPWGDFPFTGFIAMVATIGTLMVDSYATSYYQRRSGVKSEGDEVVADEENAISGHAHGGHGHTHGGHGHAHGAVTESEESGLLRHRVISQVLELGIIVHYVIIGIALGASVNPTTIKPLMVALTFHQFFEGMGLGGCITQGKFNTRVVAIMALFFSLTTPIGIAIGIRITHVYSDTSPTALIVQGVFNSASAGILIYMALVDLLAADFMSPRLQNNGKLQLAANFSLLLGAGLMALVAKWA